jgi:uncharacterized protein
MRAPIVTAILLASCALAQEYPKSNGLINDFANQLPLDAVQSLEKKLRDYKGATGNEIGVAIVRSLNGQSIEEYSLGLFRAWGVGRYGVNNGVLFVWAPSERKIRIEVGRGLQAVLTNAEASHITIRVRDLFRERRYEDGVNAAVDRIIQVIGPGSTTSEAPPAELPPPPPEESDSNVLPIALGVAVALGVGLWLVARQRRATRWREELSQITAQGNALLAQAEQSRTDAQAALVELRAEAPQDVWRQFDVRMQEAPGTLDRERASFHQLPLLQAVTYSALKTRHKAWRRWKESMTALTEGLNQVRDTLDAFRTRRSKAQQMLQDIPRKLVSMEADGVPDRAEGLLRAAADTYEQAQRESRLEPANWLLVYDLLADVDACLDQIENPTRMRYQPVRYWGGTYDSPAFNAMEMAYIASQQSQSDSGGSGMFDSGSSSSDSGFDSSGSFGGGDSGGSGSSSDY